MISIIHPTRNRPKNAFLTANKWVQKADRINNDIQYILSVDENDMSDYSLFLNNIYRQNQVFLRHSNVSAIDAINNAAKISTGDILIVVSDDTDCPEHWDKLLLDALKGKSDYCAKTDDGLQPTLITMPIMDRVYYERYGYIYNPDYEHMFCDQELTAVAIMTGKYIKLLLSFPHDHYTTGRTERDEINIKNDATWHQGETLFNQRKAINFGIEKPVVPYESILWR